MSSLVAQIPRVQTGTPAEDLVTRTYWVHEERAFPVGRIIRETAREAPVRRWRVVSDARRWLRSGDIEIELTGTRQQIRAFRERWEHTLFVHGWTEY